MKNIIAYFLFLVWTTIYWDAVQNTDLSHYIIERKTLTGSWKEVAQTNKGIEQCRVSGSNNNSYDFRVIAVDKTGNKGLPSNIYRFKFEE